jgi:phosphoribosyl 1,2-cyclic phosphodiesterase
MSLKITVLQSSSSGNSTLITNKGSHLLIDTGPDYSYLEEIFDRLQVNPKDIKGVLITHSHSDHFNLATITLCLKYNIPFYHCFSKKTAKTSLARYKTGYKEFNWARDLQHVLDGRSLEIETFSIRSFEVPHDSLEGCWGFKIGVNTGRKNYEISYCTDIARMNDEVAENFKNSHAIILESNHDVEMLKNSGRPPWLIRRIMKEGHLSNEECGDALVKIIQNSDFLPKKVVLAHISQEANTPQAATSGVYSKLLKAGYGKIPLVLTLPDDSVEIIL